jgi:hypothetical protein
VWLALRDSVQLVTLDDEILGRASIVGVTAHRP